MYLFWTITEPGLQIDDLEKRLTREATWMGFCHNDTQYGNLMLHMASDATLEAQADAEDLLDTRRSLDELPESELRSSSGLLDAALGSSPKSHSSLPQYHIPHPAGLTSSISCKDLHFQAHWEEILACEASLHEKCNANFSTHQTYMHSELQLLYDWRWSLFKA